MYMYQQKSTITNLLGKQHFNSNNEYIGGKNINRYIQQGMKSNCRCTQNKGGASSSRQLSSSSDESYRGIVIFRDLIAAVSASFWEKMLPSLQRQFQRCWMHACYDALEVRHIFASNMFQNTTSKNVIFYVTFPYGHNACNPSNNMFCSDQVYFCFKTLLLSLKLVLRYFQGCWQSILYVKKCKLI